LIAAQQMAAEYRGFGSGRKDEIASLDRRKRLKNHDVVFKRRERFEVCPAHPKEAASAA